MSIPRGFPRCFRGEDAPVGEVPPPMNVDDAMTRAIEKVGLDIYRDRDAVVQAAKDLRRIELAGVDQGSDVWVDAMQRQRDAVDRLPIVWDIPGALVENRRAEVQRLVREHGETLENLSGGAA
jgi:hypothetical protein